MWFDFVPEQLPDGTKVSRPYCRFSVVGDETQGLYGTKFLDTVQVQFSVFADDLGTANSTAKALLSAFHGAVLTLSSGTNVGSFRRAGVKAKAEQQQPNRVVYHGICVVDFKVLS